MVDVSTTEQTGEILEFSTGLTGVEKKVKKSQKKFLTGAEF